MHKQNFDLKMEVFHRRQRTAVLEEQVEKLKSQQAENIELQEVNEQLLSELEKRDKAVEEAVGIICELEEKVEGLQHKVNSLQDQLADTRPSTAQPDSECSTIGRGDSVPPSSPPVFFRPQSKTPIRSTLPTQMPVRNLIDFASPRTNTPDRRPSFLNSNSESHTALRSLYQAGQDRRTPVATSSTRDSVRDSVLSDVRSEKDMDFMNSPRLSVLSESSFLSVYGDKAQRRVEVPPAESEHLNYDEEYKTPTGSMQPAAPKQMKMARVNDWIGDGATPSEGKVPGYLHKNRTRQDSSNEDANEPSPNVSNKHAEERAEPGREKRKTAQVKPLPHQRSLQHGSSSKEGPVLGHNVLPPTPDTMSTFDNFPSLNHSASSIIAEKSLLDGTPTPARSYSALKPERRPQRSRTVVTKPSEEHMSEYEDDVESSLAPIFPSPTDFNFHHLTDKTSSASNLGRDFMFNGAEIPPSRPFRPANDRSHSMQQTHSTPHNPRSHLARMETAPISPNEWKSNSSGTETPRGQRHGHDFGRSPSTNRTTPTSPTPYQEEQTTQHHKQQRQPSDSKLPLPHTRHRPATASTVQPQQPTTKKPSLTSRIFRRSNSHSSESPSTEPQEAAPQQQKGPIPLEKRRRPRPTSVHGAEGLAGYSASSGSRKPGLGEKSQNLGARASSQSGGGHRRAEDDNGEAKIKWNLPVVGSMGLGRSSSLRTRDEKVPGRK